MGERKAVAEVPRRCDSHPSSAAVAKVTGNLVWEV